MSDRRIASAPRTPEQRGFGRRTTCKPARVILPSGGAVACIVVDESEGGAAFRLTTEQALPETFQLLIEPDDVLVGCRLVHHTNGRFGVAFINSPRIASRVNSKASLKGREVAEFLSSRDARLKFCT